MYDQHEIITEFCSCVLLLYCSLLSEIPDSQMSFSLCSAKYLEVKLTSSTKWQKFRNLRLCLGNILFIEAQALTKVMNDQQHAHYN